MPKSQDTAPAEGEFLLPVPADLFHDHIHVCLMEAACLVATIRKAIAIDDDHAEEYAALAIAVRLLYRLDDDLEAQFIVAERAFDTAHPEYPAAVARRQLAEECIAAQVAEEGA